MSRFSMVLNGVRLVAKGTKDWRMPVSLERTSISNPVGFSLVLNSVMGVGFMATRVAFGSMGGGRGPTGTMGDSSVTVGGFGPNSGFLIVDLSPAEAVSVAVVMAHPSIRVGGSHGSALGPQDGIGNRGQNDNEDAEPEWHDPSKGKNVAVEE